MHIDISLSDGVPIYRQIVNQIKYSIASGKIRAGDELPTIRGFAEQLTVTPNTIVKAYGELETEGLIYSAMAGTFVADLKSPLARREQRRILEQRADVLLAEASQLDFTFEEVVELLKKQHAKLVQSLARTKKRADSNAG